MKFNSENIMRGLRLIQILDFDKNSKIGPLRVDISVTSACNFHCVFCGTHSYLRPETVKPVNMDKGILSDLLYDLNKLGTQEILFAGNGEPLLYEPLPSIVRQYGNSFKIEVLTNGSLLDRVNQDMFNHLAHLSISLNSGTGKSHQVTHGYKGSNLFTGIINNIDRLINYKNGDKKIKLFYVITKDNANEIPIFNAIAKEWGVDCCARQIDVSGFTEVESKRAEPVSIPKLNACYLGFVQTTIAADGNILQCFGTTDNPLGNLYQKRFSQSWPDARAKYLQAVSMGKTGKAITPKCAGCANAIASGVTFHKVYSRIPILNRRVNRSQTIQQITRHGQDDYV